MKKMKIVFMVSGCIMHVQAADQALALLQAAKDHAPYYTYHGAHHAFGPLAVGLDKVKEKITQKNALTELIPTVAPLYVNMTAVVVGLYMASDYVPWRSLATSGGTTLYTMGVQEIMSQSKHYKNRWGDVHPSIKFPWFFIVKTMFF